MSAPIIQLPNLFVVGPSGSGKSSALRNLDPEKTAVLNINRKALPFKSAIKFKYNKMINSYGELTTELIMGVGMNPAIDVIAIDDFTSADESILDDCRKNYTGWDIFAKHNQKVRELISTSKDLCVTKLKPDGSVARNPKWIIWLGLDEIVNVAQTNGTTQAFRRIKVDGKELAGTIEKEFTIVLFTNVAESKMPGKTGQFEYKFLVNSDGVCSAKTPMELFRDRLIDNDLNFVIKETKKYYALPE